jgi:predicted DNA-binding transcriptional regulator YafY
MDETNDLAERMTRAGDAFTLVAIQKKSLRAAAEALGVSHVTVARDVAAYSKFLADARGKESVDERRARQYAVLEDLTARALEVFNYCMAGVGTGKKMPLAASAALNTMVALQPHYRAIGALDSPKEIRQDVDQHIRVVWGDDEDETPARNLYPND